MLYSELAAALRRGNPCRAVFDGPAAIRDHIHHYTGLPATSATWALNGLIRRGYVTFAPFSAEYTVGTDVRPESDGPIPGTGAAVEGRTA